MNKEATKAGIIFLLAVFFLGGLFFGFLSSKNYRFPQTNINKEDQLNQKIKKMSLDEKISQFLFLGGDFRNINSLDWRLKAGGIIINLKLKNQNEKLIREEILNIQEKIASQSGIEPFFGADQEGGEVCRLDWLDCTSQKMINSKSQVLILAKKRGEDLKRIGINLVFAPVLDISDNKTDFIWGRTFATADPKEAAELGLAMVGGFNQSGIIACPKHFPGHGGTSSDSHQKLPLVDCDQSCLESRIYPFKKVIDNGVKMVMVGHIKIKLKAQNSNVKTTAQSEKVDQLPASISPYWINDILRNQLEFSGVVITDDLMMRALEEVEYPDERLDKTKDFWWAAPAAVQAIKAGADMVIISDNSEIQKEVFERLKKAVETKEISEERLNESLKRILKIKLLLNHKN
jgi:beta-N-acetylhexosaminidase